MLTEKATHHLSERVLNMTESATLKMSKLARELASKGHDVISLSIGEPDFDTPEHIKEAAKRALDAGLTKYTPVAGTPELRQAIRDKFLRDNGLDYQINEIVVSNGAKQSIANLSMALLNPGDEGILFTPYWVSYSDIITLTGGVPVPVVASIEQDFKVLPSQLEQAITGKTRFVLFSSPCNPTGSVYTREELEAIAEVLVHHPDIVIISDEIYEYINFSDSHASIGAIESVRDRTVTVNGFSKGFAMTGWRLGYMGAPRYIADACEKLQGQSTSGATAFGQAAATYALNADLGPTYRMRDAFLRRRDIVIELLSQVPGMQVNKPMGAFYIFPNISNYFGLSDGHGTIRDSDDLALYLLATAHVATVAGAPFGAPDCLRISYAASEENIREAIRRIAEALAQLR